MTTHTRSCQGPLRGTNVGSLPQSGHCGAQNWLFSGVQAGEELSTRLKNQAAKFGRARADFLRYSGLPITPQAIRGGAPLSVELLTACTTSAVPPLLKTE